MNEQFEADAPQNQNTCLVLMPWDAQNQVVWEFEIKPGIESAGYSPVRIDQLEGLLVSTTWSAVRDSGAVIADLTGRNPNVFYELGLAHALGKPTILITQSIEDVPFDLRHIRIINYDLTGRPGFLARSIAASLQNIRKYSSAVSGERFGVKPKSEMTTEQLNTLLAQAEAAGNEGQIDDAIRSMQLALEASRRVDKRESTATILNNLGSLYQQKGDYSSAREYLLQALEVLRGLREPGGEAAAYGNLANVLQSQGDYERAAEFYRRAIEASARLADERSVAHHMANLATLVQREHPGEAEQYYQRATAIFHKLSDYESVARIWTNWATMKISQRDFEGAEQLLRRAEAHFREAGSKAELSRVLHNLGSLMIERGDFVSAESYLRTSLAAKEETGDVGGAAASLTVLANVAATRGDLDAALEYLMRAADIYKRTENSAGLAKTFIALARVLQAGNRADDAIRLLELLQETIARSAPESEEVLQLLGQLRSEGLESRARH